jgi:hypothetical protein
MTEFQSNPEIDDELLSAYLDDELSPDERARVDARLAADPAARQMLDQLRAASLALQSLPHETVGEDLRESILRRAEAAMLTSNGSETAASAAKTGTTDGAVNLRDSLPRLTIGQTRRGWVWAGLAMAAGLLIMVLQPGGEQGGDLPQVAASRRAEDVDKLAAADRADVPELRQLRPAESAAPAAVADHDSYSEGPTASPANAPVATGNEAAPPPDTIALDAAAAPAEPADATSTLSINGGLAAKDGARLARAPAPEERFGVAAEPSARAGGALADRRSLDQLGDNANEAKDTIESLSPAATDSVAAPDRDLAETPPQGAVGDEMHLGMAVTGQPAPADALAKAPVPASDADYLVVHVVVKPEALRSRAFDQLLFKNGIQLEESLEEEGASKLAPDTRAAKQSFNRKLNRFDVAAQDESGKLQPEDMVLVAAPRATIESCLSELKQDRANYLVVAVDDSTAEAARDEGDKSLKEAAPSKRKLATDLGARFNRGSVPPQDAEAFREFYFYDVRAGGGEEASGRGGFGGGGEGGDRRGALKQELDLLSASRESSGGTAEMSEQLGRGRARRVRSLGYDEQSSREKLIGGQSVADGRGSLAAPRQYGAVAQRAQAPAEVAGETLQVLFVLSLDNEWPAAAAPSPPARNRQE